MIKNIFFFRVYINGCMQKIMKALAILYLPTHNYYPQIPQTLYASCKIQNQILASLVLYFTAVKLDNTRERLWSPLNIAQHSAKYH